ncbi:MAG TPA: hypothetical protein VD931_03830 [Baekduia sp.]|nr:hypothetical protein [Baekduia sp.]
MSGPPVKKLGDDGRRRGDDVERRFAYFTPAKRKASLYEDVTCDTQPSVHRHVARGWPVSFEDGRGVWSDDSTALRSSDWYAFRDPGQLWERPFYQQGTQAEAQIEAAVKGAANERMFDDFTPEWIEFLRENLQVPAFAEHGLWLATASVGRDCLSDSVTHCVVLQAAQKQRVAQSIVLYAMDLEEQFGEQPIEAAKQRWLEHPAWQPTREFVEHLHATNDWAEVIVATNLCFEPLVGDMYRRELGIRAATANRDTVTPIVARTAQTEWEWVAAWTAKLTHFLLEDEAHGAHNREVLAGWLAKWLPKAIAAAEALTAIAEQLPGEFDVDAARERVRRDAAAFHEQCGITELVGVTA